jgi:hypothetical protein
MTVSLSSVTPIPADASEEIKLWIMQLADEVSAELENADREIITQVKVGEDRDLAFSIHERPGRVARRCQSGSLG